MKRKNGNKSGWHHIAGVYLIQDTSGQLYAGQTYNMAHRYDSETLNRVVAFVHEDGKLSRYAIEQEAIEFLQAFGIPSDHILNIQHNSKESSYHLWRQRIEAWNF